jgi:hypothetical protein
MSVVTQSSSFTTPFVWAGEWLPTLTQEQEDQLQQDWDEFANETQTDWTGVLQRVWPFQKRLILEIVQYKRNAFQRINVRRRSGVSTALVTAVSHLAVTKPDFRCMFWVKTKQARMRIMRLFQEMIQCERNRNELILPNGSSIVFMAYNANKAYIGCGPHLVIIDNADTLPQDTLLRVIVPMYGIDGTAFICCFAGQSLQE